MNEPTVIIIGIIALILVLKFTVGKIAKTILGLSVLMIFLYLLSQGANFGL